MAIEQLRIPTLIDVGDAVAIRVESHHHFAGITGTAVTHWVKTVAPGYIKGDGREMFTVELDNGHTVEIDAFDLEHIIDRNG